MKAEKRTLLGLPPLPEDSIKVIRNMRAASPPASASDLIEQQQKRGRREHKVRQQRAPGLLRDLRVHTQGVELGHMVPGGSSILEISSNQADQEEYLHSRATVPNPRLSV